MKQNPKYKTLSTLLMTGIFAIGILLAGCHTGDGMKKDLDDAGDAIKEGVEEVGDEIDDAT